MQKQMELFRAGTGPEPVRRADACPAAGAPMARAHRPGASPGRTAARVPVAAAPEVVGAAASAEGASAAAGGGGPGGGGGRLQFALYHTWHFTDRVLVADGGPTLDLLNGDAIGGSGGQPRHEVELQAGYSNNGIGARLSVNYRSGTEVRGGTTAASPVGTLNFGALATADLRMFADLGQRLDLVRKHPWLRGTRVALSVHNLLEHPPAVTDATGTVPVNFQPGYARSARPHGAAVGPQAVLLSRPIRVASQRAACSGERLSVSRSTW